MNNEGKDLDKIRNFIRVYLIILPAIILFGVIILSKQFLNQGLKGILSLVVILAGLVCYYAMCANILEDLKNKNNIIDNAEEDEEEQ